MRARPGTPEVSIVVPLFRTARTLPELHRRIERSLDGHDWELVLVDDGCPEGSGAVADELAAADGRLVVVHNGTRRGQHPSLLAGLRRARGPSVVCIDGDLQDPPEVIPRLVAAVQDGADVAFGVDGEGSARRRTLPARIYKAAVAAMTGAPRGVRTFLALDEGAVARILELERNGAGVAPMAAAVARAPAAVPAGRAPRTVGRSGYTAVARLALGLHSALWLAWFYGSRRRSDTGARWPVGVVALGLAVVSGLWFGFGYEIWPANDVLAYALRYDGGLQNDWITGLATSHWFVAHLLGALPAWALEPAVVAIWALTLLGLWLGFALLADSLAIPPVAALAAGLLLVPTRLDGIGPRRCWSARCIPTARASRWRPAPSPSSSAAAPPPPGSCWAWRRWCIRGSARSPASSSAPPRSRCSGPACGRCCASSSRRCWSVRRPSSTRL